MAKTETSATVTTASSGVTVVPSIALKTCPAGTNVLQQAQIVENRFVVQIPHADTLQEVCQPEYFSHHAARITPLAVLTCIDEHRRWEADLRVLQKGPTFLKVVVIRHVTYDAQAQGAADTSKVRAGFRIEARGANGWRVIDKLGKELIAGLINEAEANAYLDMHIETMTQKAA